MNYKKLKLYFDSILNFDQDNFKSIGTHHLDIILSNSVVPILYSHYNLNGDRFMSAKMKNMMFNLKGCLINSKIILLSKKMGLNLKIINSKFLYQLGIFYIFDNFCLNFSTIKSGTNPEISPL